MKKLFLFPLALLLSTCIKEKSPMPVAYTLGVTNLNVSSADVVVSVTGLNITQRGACWSKTKDPIASGNHTADNSGKGNFTVSASGLENNTTYFVRAYATNESGTAYGDNFSFTTPIMPTVTTNGANSIAQNSVSINCNFIQSPTFTINSLGLCWGTSPNPTVGNNKIIFTTQNLNSTPYSVSITSLTPNTKYYVRAYASSSIAITYGNELNFTTLKPVETGSVSDNQGNVYQTVKIGDQEWMAQNLKVLYYNNGDAIYIPTTPTNWAGLQIGACCAYNNNSNNQSNYGTLYNYYAITDPRGIAPPGWHVPTQQDWVTLVNYVGQTNAASKLRANSVFWYSNVCTANTFSFSALPGGYRDLNGYDYAINNEACFWSSTASGSNGYITNFQSGNCDLYTGFQNFKYGYSVRCVKD